MTLQRTRWAGVYRRGRRFAAVASAGGRKTWRTFDTAQEARTWKAEQDAERRQDTERKQGYARRRNPTVAEILDAHARVHDRDWKQLTKVQRSSLRRIHVDAAIGARRVDELLVDRSHLRNLYASLSPAQGRNIHGMLRAAFRWAVAKEMVERDPTDLVKPPTYRKPQARYLDLEDVRRLRELVSGGPLEGSVILGLGGLRAAEAVFVRRGDLADNVLHVKGSSWAARPRPGAPGR